MIQPATVSLRSRLMLIAAAGILPVALGAGFALGTSLQDRWQAAEARSLELARLTASAVDTEVQRSYAALYVAASSPTLDRGDFSRFGLLLERVLASDPDWRALVLSDLQGKVLISVGKGPAADLPGLFESQSMARVLRKRVPALGYIEQNEHHEWGIPVRVPVERYGALVYVLTAILKPDAFVRVVKAQQFPEDWTLSVLDARGVRVARSRDHERLVGQPAGPLLYQRLAGAPFAVDRTLEGTQVASGIYVMPGLGWICGIGIPTAEIWAAFLEAAALYLLGFVASLALGVMFAAVMAQRIKRPITELAAAADQMGRGWVPSVPATHIAEIASLGRVLRSAARAREALEVDHARTQSQAADAGRRLSVALDSSTVPFNIISPVRDASGVIVDFSWDYVNRVAAKEIGREVEDVIGQRVGRLVPGAWQVPGLFETLVGVAESGSLREFEISTQGPERWLQVVATPMFGQVAVWMADVTQRRQQERALQLADRRKDEFLAILAHELRNPLAPIQQAAMIASLPGVGESERRWSQDVIARQVRHMALLLEDLLDVSRITRGKLELRRARIELRAAIDAAVETARPHLEEKSQRLTVELPDKPVMFDGDPLRIAQVVTNLLTNAARYTGPGGEVRLKAEAQRGRVVITVEDSGSGIAPEHLESIFEMFSQAPRSSGQGGLGIGLALARGIAQLHGGTLTAASDGPGKGSRFTFTLPVAAIAPTVPLERSAMLTDSGPPRRILIADDNRDAADTLASLLRAAGHEVWLAYDGESALKEAEARHPDVALLDIGMPGLSGVEVARRVRGVGAGSPVLVALTGWGRAQDRLHTAGAGFDHHLTKPVDLEALYALLRDLPHGGMQAANA